MANAHGNRTPGRFIIIIARQTLSGTYANEEAIILQFTATVFLDGGSFRKNEKKDEFSIRHNRQAIRLREDTQKKLRSKRPAADLIPNLCAGYLRLTPPSP